MIPQDKTAAVSHGLSEAFGVTKLEDVRDLTERPGSNLAFRIVVGGSAYLLRINTRPGDTARHYACMSAAADAGLAPRVWYTSAEDRISISDFVVAKPFAAPDALVRIPAALRTLHALPPFATSPFNTTCTFLLNGGSFLERFLVNFRASSLLSHADTEQLFAGYTKIAGAYVPLAVEMAPCHNDLFKPDNMLFDGSRLWLVDWEAAFQNDRYADLAVVANMLVTNDLDESIFLQEYFGAPANEYQKARLYLMRQLAHMFYAMAFLTIENAGKPIDGSVPPPAYRDLQQRFWAGEFRLTDNASKTVYGRVHWEEVSRNMRQPRFEEALQIVSARKG